MTYQWESIPGEDAELVGNNWNSSYHPDDYLGNFDFKGWEMLQQVGIKTTEVP